MLTQQIFNGLMLGGLYALLAVGFSFLFGVLRLINFSHGSVFMVGAFVTYTLVSQFGLSFIPAVLIGAVVSGLIGIIVERLSVAPLRRRKMPYWLGMITTFGMALIIENLAQIVFGSNYKAFPIPIEVTSFQVAGSRFTNIQIIILTSAVLLMVLLVLFTKYTWLGRAFRAVAQNPDAASLMGVNVSNIVALGFFISGFLACSAGVLVAMYQGIVSVNMGLGVGLKGFISSALGGIGSIFGAMLGGFILGIVEALTSAYISANVKDIVSFLVLIIVLLWRPNGLLGKEQL